MITNESLSLARLRTMARAYHDEAARLDREIAYRTGEVIEVFDQENADGATGCAVEEAAPAKGTVI